ncbi:MAG TPA: PLD nuclease N-terminal domain-containing protein [Anaerolineae bacterium]|nr:PLD nuclease N-terminal domain-containing protein [Anaerolineae bacterium]
MELVVPEWLILVIPIVILQLALVVVGLMDLARRERTKGPKWMWALIVLFIGVIGPVVYFVFGREE